MAAILQVDPQERASLEFIMQHPWITRRMDSTLCKVSRVWTNTVKSQRRKSPLPCGTIPWLLLLRPQFKTEHFAPGEVIMRKGEVGDRLYFINAGNCEVLMDALADLPSENDTAVLAVRHAGEYIGELAVMETIRSNGTTVGKRTATVRAR